MTEEEADTEVEAVSENSLDAVNLLSLKYVKRESAICGCESSVVLLRAAGRSVDDGDETVFVVELCCPPIACLAVTPPVVDDALVDVDVDVELLPLLADS